MIGCPSSSHRGSSSQETRTTGRSKKAWGGTGQPELKACRLALTLTSNLQEAGAQTPLGGAESPALAKPSVGQPLRGRRLRSSRGPELSEPLLPTSYRGRKVTRGPLLKHPATLPTIGIKGLSLQPGPWREAQALSSTLTCPCLGQVCTAACWLGRSSSSQWQEWLELFLPCVGCGEWETWPPALGLLGPDPTFRLRKCF